MRPVGLVNFHGAGWGFLLAGASRASLTVRKGTESGLGRGSSFSGASIPATNIDSESRLCIPCLALHDQSWWPQHSCTQWPALPSHEMTPSQIYKSHDILVQIDPLWALSLGKHRKNCETTLTLLGPAFFGSLSLGGQIFPHPLKMGVTDGRFKN